MDLSHGFATSVTVLKDAIATQEAKNSHISTQEPLRKALDFVAKLT